MTDTKHTSDIDNIEVSLSNFAGQETVTVKEFLAHAFMVVAEASYHEGYNDGARIGNGQMDNTFPFELELHK